MNDEDELDLMCVECGYLVPPGGMADHYRLAHPDSDPDNPTGFH